MLKRSSKTGFTLVELSFSIAFISILSLTLVAIIMHMTSTYQHGIALKQINTTGSDLADDLRAAIADSSAKNLTDLCGTYYVDNSTASNDCMNDGAYSFTYLVRMQNVTIAPGTASEKKINSTPVFGAFCSGSYSYIWNSGYLLDSKNYQVTNVRPATLTYYDINGEQRYIDNFRLLKIVDPSRAVCVSSVNKINNNKYTQLNGIINSLDSDFVIKKDEFGYITEDPIDVLASSGSNELALYDLSIQKPAQDTTTRNIFYSGSFILATILGGINIKASGNYCATPSEYLIEYFDYCAINKFNFAIRASGE